MNADTLRIIWVGPGRPRAGVEPRQGGPRLVVDELESGAEALDFCLGRRGAPPDAVVVPWSLPDMGAPEFLRRVGDPTGMPTLPVVLVLDGPEQIAVAREALRQGVQDYVLRDGLTSEVLRDAVEKGADRFSSFARLRSRRDALDWKNRRLRSLIDQVPNVISILDREGRYRYVNAAVERASGLTPEHFFGKTNREAGAPEALWPTWDAKLDEVFRDGHEATFEYQGDRRDDGSRSWYQVRLAPDRGPTGEVEAVLGVTSDVTVLKEASESIRRSEQLLRRVLDGVVMMVGVLTPDGVLVEANRPALAIAGLRPEDVLGRPFDQTYWWAYAPEAQEQLRETIRRAREGQASRYDVDVRIGPDRFMTIDFMLVPLIDDRGVVTHLIPSAIDITDRKRTERAIRDLAEREQNRANELRTVLKAAPTAIWIAEGRDCARIHGNAAADRLLRVERGRNISATAPGIELQARGFLEYRNGVRVEPKELPLQLASERGIEVTDAELTLQFADGTVRHIYGNASPLRNSQGEIYGAIAAFIDITKLKEAQEALRANEERFALATQAVNGLIYDWDVRTGRVSRSAALYDSVGYHPDEVDADASWWSDRIHPDDVPVTEQLFSTTVAERGEAVQLEYRVRHRDGSWRHIWDRCRIVYGEDGRPTRLVGYSIDVTDRVLSEEALRESERKFHKLATSDVIGVVLGDTKGGLSYVNDAFLRTLGYARDEFEGRRIGWAELTPPEWLEVDRSRIAEALEGRPAPAYEKEYFAKDGGRVPVLVGFTLLSEREDGVVAFVLDLTERKRAERALKDADRRKDEFLAMLAHELRNPLAAIGTAAHILQAKGSADPELVWGRDVILRQVQHLTRLIEDLLDVSRITTGKIKLRMAPLDVRTIVNQAAESLYPTITQRKHDLRVVLPPHPLMAVADPSRLEQVLSNLLTNAAKFTDEGGAITVSGALEGSWIVLKVRDSGIGISDEAIGHIFDLFAQLDRNSERSQGGLGIGLALVKSLVQMHGGNVEVASDGPGAGSEFTVRIPPMATPAADPAGPSTPGASASLAMSGQGGARVLVVDDNRDIAMGMSKMLEVAGYDIRTVTDGVDALRLTREFQPHYVLLDIGLPKLDGYEVARAIRRQGLRPRPVLIAISGYGQEVHRALARDAGFDHHLLKPVSADELLPLLKARHTE